MKWQKGYISVLIKKEGRKNYARCHVKNDREELMKRQALTKRFRKLKNLDNCKDWDFDSIELRILFAYKIGILNRLIFVS